MITLPLEAKHPYRTVAFYKNYFEEFFVKQRDKVKEKIVLTFDLIEEVERVPETYLKPFSNDWKSTKEIMGATGLNRAAMSNALYKAGKKILESKDHPSQTRVKLWRVRPGALSEN